MKARLVIFAMVLVTFVQTPGQHVIGLDKEAVKTLIIQELQGFSLDHTIVKQEFNYLKYVNSIDTKTFLVYFDDQDIAKSAKMVCDYAEYDFVRDELDKKFKKAGKDQWKYRVGRDEFLVTLTELDWYFTVSYKRSE